MEYDGTEFCGWQKQANDRTVQAEIENALKEFGEGDIPVTGAGRTDSGVHALGQVAHFDLNGDIAPEVLKNALNAKIPEDIVIKSTETADSAFHARFDAVWRRYLYILSKSPTVIGRRYSWFPPYDYRFTLLESIASELIGEHNFAAFCKSKSLKESALCTVIHAAWTENEAQYVFEITADRFLHSMVRLIVGTMMDVARGRFQPGTLSEILQSKDVNRCGTGAPPQGLFLAEVRY